MFRRYARAVLGSIDFANEKAFFLLCLGVLALAAGVVILVRRGTTGRYLDALRGSEVAATAVGINPTRARITAFSLSAGIAGLGGGLLATQTGQANYNANFTSFFGLFWVVLVVTLGARSVQGAVNAGLGLVLFPQLLKLLGLSGGYEYIFFGLGALTYAQHPEGIIEAQTRRSLQFVQGLVERRRKKQSTVDITDDGGDVVQTHPEPVSR